MTSDRTNVCIVGASGYTGSELIRVLTGHPRVTITAVTSESNAGARITDVHPHLTDLTDLRFQSLDDIDADAYGCTFLALPHGTSMKVVREIRTATARVVDLSGDFRLGSAETYTRWYGMEHVCPEWIGDAAYGLPELNRAAVAEADLVANPGCFPTSTILALAPLVAEALVELSGIVVDSKTGVTGAGATASATTHFPTVNDSFKAYKIAAHRHTPEMEETLSRVAREPVSLLFTPHLLPINRGILSTVYARPRADATPERVAESFRAHYADEPFVRLRDDAPAVADVRGTNFCDVWATLDERTGTVIVVSAIDNLVKGAAGQAVQNMNLMLGFSEREGLVTLPWVP